MDHIVRAGRLHVRGRDRDVQLLSCRLRLCGILDRINGYEQQRRTRGRYGRALTCQRFDGGQRWRRRSGPEAQKYGAAQPGERLLPSVAIAQLQIRSGKRLVEPGSRARILRLASCPCTASSC